MRSRMLKTLFAAATLSSLVAPAIAETIHLKADLTGASEVPAKQTSGNGTLSATLDTETHVLTYRVVYDGLSGPITAAHFHGPAGEGVNAKPQVPVKGPFDAIDGTATITPEQQRDLLDGKWYFNLHTAANPGGEVRGQVLKAAH